MKKKSFIDLHLHIDGSISVDSARKLAEIENIVLPESDKELKTLLTVSKYCKDLNEYLEKFELPISLLQSEKSLESCAFNLCKELDESGCAYAELRFAPQKHLKKGLSQEQAVNAVLSGIKKSLFNANLILCCMRDCCDNRKENLETVRLVKSYLDKGVCACDLAGAEALFPNKNYADIFLYAKKLEIPFTIHSGEASGAESVMQAINMGSSRIGHGVRSIEDKNVVGILARNKIPLEICPTSNLNTQVFKSYKEIPIPQFLSEGVIITINSDNMSVSDTNSLKELEIITKTFNFDKDIENQLILNSVDSSFASKTVKENLRTKVLAEI